MKRKGGSLRELAIAAAASLVTVIATSWIADGLNGQCLLVPLLGDCQSGAPATFWVRVLFALILFAAAVTVLSRTASGLLPARQLKSHSKVTGHRALIAGISPFWPKPKELDGEWTVCGKDQGLDKRVVLVGDLNEDIKVFSTYGWKPNIQQYLRSLKPHLGTLERLILIGTAGERGSFGSLACAAPIARLYFPNAIIETHARPVGSEDIDSLQACFDFHIERLLLAGFREEDIILDVTSGQKPMSIAAAMTTLSWRRIEFQYVQTEPDEPGHENRVIGFNLALESRDIVTGA